MDRGRPNKVRLDKTQQSLGKNEMTLSKMVLNLVPGESCYHFVEIGKQE